MLWDIVIYVVFITLGSKNRNSLELAREAARQFVINLPRDVYPDVNSTVRQSTSENEKRNEDRHSDVGLSTDSIEGLLKDPESSNVIGETFFWTS